MAVLKPQCPQKRYLYSGRWTRSHDRTFTNMLHYQAICGCPQTDPTRINKYALKFTASSVSRAWNWPFQPKTYLWRLEHLRTRYTTFKEIIEDTAFTWDITTNRVHATKEAWEALIQEIPFADVYLEKGEPEWEKLRKIFEPSPNDGIPVEVHNISSGEDTDEWSESDEWIDTNEEIRGFVDLVSSDSD